MEDQKCRICGCTENDCSQCIKLTGKPCHWVESDLCSACADALKLEEMKKGMKFFSILSSMGEVDLTMRIMKKDDTLTINIMPGSNSSKTKPFIVTGSPEELDEQFFGLVWPQVKEIEGIRTNIDEVRESITEEDEENEEKEAPSKQSAAKKPTKGAAKKPVKKIEKKDPPKQDQPVQQLFPDA